MKVGIANDHAATSMKKELMAYLQEKGYEVVNYGTDGNESVDYPDYGAKLAKAVAAGEVDRGIAICGTGVGMSIVCNKVKGVRCVHCSETFSAEYGRRHNDANVVAFGARVIGMGIAKQIVDVFLTTEFEGGRHQRRVDKIKALEEEQ
ncbi:MAG: ribose 5-phosphate isomerase B [Lactimicrobium sp.]|jgi:ribose 5-phosphate isomerase B|uniref:ribose 5-phosphate isomerase B n=1 Tax=Lactimicrobium sp. TaxID=2563780 RepID=UPI002F34FAA1